MEIHRYTWQLVCLDIFAYTKGKKRKFKFKCLYLEKSPEITEMLINAGANINITTTTKDSPLHFAAKQSNSYFIFFCIKITNKMLNIIRSICLFSKPNNCRFVN